MSPGRLSIDLFCRVVDNYGDIGVCWRLARQLVTDQNCAVRLIVDDLEVFHKIEPRLDKNAALQTIETIIIMHWTEAVLLQHFSIPGNAVIEAFGCALPDIVIEKMQDEVPQPVWLDLEYLSAEDWVGEYHAIPSLHPATNLQKTLFFPGFSQETGGLFRESGLLAERSKFVNAADLQNIWRREHGLPEKSLGVYDLSLFCYPIAAVQKLLADLENSPSPIRVFVPEGIAAAQLGDISQDRGSLRLVRIPFLSQCDYDRLLWTCDLNFVRGEDSWVRALWAAKPFIWQAYPQDDGASELKLRAFLSRYTAGLSPKNAESLADFHAMWNLGGRESKSGLTSWCELLHDLPVFSRHAELWTTKQAGQEDCATKLTRFIRQQITNQTPKVTG